MIKTLNIKDLERLQKKLEKFPIDCNICIECELVSEAGICACDMHDDAYWEMENETK
jgi:hypothetical protein